MPRFQLVVDDWAPIEFAKTELSLHHGFYNFRMISLFANGKDRFQVTFDADMDKALTSPNITLTTQGVISFSLVKQKVKQKQ